VIFSMVDTVLPLFVLDIISLLGRDVLLELR
jgi:hypothetical protein